MKALDVLKHGAITLLGLALLFGTPFFAMGLYKTAGDDVDAVSSASVILDAPSCEYVVLINRNLHTNAEKLDQWITFFSGGDAGVIFEDISCAVADGDAGGADMARSLQSRLPENQMRIQKENGTLLLSRADFGKFDVILLSQEYAQATDAATAYGENVEVVHISGGAA